MSRRYEISAVHEKDLKELLSSLNLLEEVNEGHIHCKFCDTVITLENLQCIYPKGDEIVFCCDKIGCFEQALKDFKEDK
jgi:hypothetical protein